MKKIGLVILMMFCLGIFSPAVAGPNVYTFSPTPPELWELTHTYNYKWGINWSGHTGETITEAVLTFKGIYDWTREYNDHLYVHLLDNPPLGVTVRTDYEGGGDNFYGMGYWIGTWSDPYGDYNHRINLSYSLSSLGLIDELNDYAANGVFGFGIDPDCHYYNDGVELVVTTSVVPEPGTLSLLGFGLISASMYLRRKK